MSRVTQIPLNSPEFHQLHVHEKCQILTSSQSFSFWFANVEIEGKRHGKAISKMRAALYLSSVLLHLLVDRCQTALRFSLE